MSDIKKEKKLETFGSRVVTFEATLVLHKFDFVRLSLDFEAHSINELCHLCLRKEKRKKKKRKKKEINNKT